MTQKLPEAVLQKLAELRPAAQARAKKADANTRLQRARRSFKKSMTQLQSDVGRIKQAIAEGGQLCSPKETEWTREALIRTAKWLVEVAGEIDEVVYGPMIGEGEDEQRKRA